MTVLDTRPWRPRVVPETATVDLDDAQLRAHPGSGRLFTAAVDVPGAPLPHWSPPGSSRSSRP